MTTATALTVAEKVLLAARELDKAGTVSFTSEDLVVKSWQLHADAFGLSGYRHHPDSNRVISAVVGKRGLVCIGWLLKVAPKRYRLSKLGREVAARLRGESAPEPVGQLQPISRGHEATLKRLLGSIAYAKFEGGEKAIISFADACHFWELGPTTTGQDLDQLFAALESALNDIESHLADQDGQLSTGRLVTAGDCRLLRNISRYLADRFGRHLDLLRNRTRPQSA